MEAITHAWHPWDGLTRSGLKRWTVDFASFVCQIAHHTNAYLSPTHARTYEHGISTDIPTVIVIQTQWRSGRHTHGEDAPSGVPRGSTLIAIPSSVRFSSSSVLRYCGT